MIIRDFVTTEKAREISARAEEATKDISRKGIFSNITKGLEKRDSYFGELLRNGPQVPIIETLLGRKPEPTTASLFTKINNDQEVHPHSDAIDGAVTWIALDKTDKHNGCLHFLKGSHKREAEFAHLRAHTPTDLSDHPDLFEAAISRSSGPPRFTGRVRTMTDQSAGGSTASTRATLGARDGEKAARRIGKPP